MNANRGTTAVMTPINVPLVSLVPLLTVVLLSMPAFAIDCIQCDRQGIWYSPEENQRHVARCQQGVIEPTRCTNTSHTHCIFSYYKQDGAVTVTERRCGIEEDITGCTLYKSMKRMRRHERHLIGGSVVDSPMPYTHHRRRETLLLVEVCTSGCVEDGCISGAAGVSTITMLSMALFMLPTLAFAPMYR